MRCVCASRRNGRMTGEEHSGHRQGPAAGAVGFADRDAIAHRADELFQERGREIGQDTTSMTGSPGLCCARFRAFTLT